MIAAISEFPPQNFAWQATIYGRNSTPFLFSWDLLMHLSLGKPTVKAKTAKGPSQNC